MFDDFEDNTEEYQSYWVEMCPHCHNRYKGILGKRASHGAMGTCSVKGCENEAKYYVDFEEGEVSHSIGDMAGIILNFTELDKIMTFYSFFSEQEIISSDNALGKIIEDGCICYTHKGKNGEPGEPVNLTFEVIIMASKAEDLSATMVKITGMEIPNYACLSGVDSDYSPHLKRWEVHSFKESLLKKVGILTTLPICPYAGQFGGMGYENLIFRGKRCSLFPMEVFKLPGV